jgi:hypothetical protein
MREHPREAAVQEQALWCLYWLTFKHAANRSKVVYLGGRDLVAKAAANHSTVKCITGFVPTVQYCLSDAVAVDVATAVPAQPSATPSRPTANLASTPVCVSGVSASVIFCFMVLAAVAIIVACVAYARTVADAPATEMTPLPSPPPPPPPPHSAGH